MHTYRETVFDSSVQLGALRSFQLAVLKVLAALAPGALVELFLLLHALLIAVQHLRSDLFGQLRIGLDAFPNKVKVVQQVDGGQGLRLLFFFRARLHRVNQLLQTAN
jgi:hypothetical protein